MTLNQIRSHASHDQYCTTVLRGYSVPDKVLCEETKTLP